MGIGMVGTDELSAFCTLIGFRHPTSSRDCRHRTDDQTPSQFETRSHRCFSFVALIHFGSAGGSANSDGSASPVSVFRNATRSLCSWLVKNSGLIRADLSPPAFGSPPWL